jgi:hypothetical protein
MAPWRRSRPFADVKKSKDSAQRQLSRLRDDWIKKIEAAAGIIISVAKGLEPGCNHARLGRVKLVNFEPNVVQRSALGKDLGDLSGIACSVGAT